MDIFLLEDDMNRVEQFEKRRKELGDRLGVECHLYHAIDVESAKRMLPALLSVDLWLLDHDLGGRVYVPENDENTGSAFIRWVLNEPAILNRPINILVHSLNEPAAKRMVLGLKEAGKKSCWIPFLWNKETFHGAIQTRSFP